MCQSSENLADGILAYGVVRRSFLRRHSSMAGRRSSHDARVRPPAEKVHEELGERQSSAGSAGSRQEGFQIHDGNSEKFMTDSLFRKG